MAIALYMSAKGMGRRTSSLLISPNLSRSQPNKSYAYRMQNDLHVCVRLPITGWLDAAPRIDTIEPIFLEAGKKTKVKIKGNEFKLLEWPRESGLIILQNGHCWKMKTTPIINTSLR